MTSLSVMVSLHAKRCFSDSGISRSSAKLESDNEHAEAAAKLINQYGTSDEKKEIADINARHMKIGYISGPDYRRRIQMTNKYYSRLK